MRGAGGGVSGFRGGVGEGGREGAERRREEELQAFVQQQQVRG